MLNGSEIGTVTARDRSERRGLRLYSFLLPAPALRQGLNVLEFHTDRYDHPPADAPDQRQLSTLWDWMEFGTALRKHSAVADGDHLSIVGPSRLEYYLQVPPNSHLEWRAIEPWNAATLPSDAAFEALVRWDADAAPERFRFDAGTMTAPQDLALANRAGGDAVVSFTAIVDGGYPDAPDGLTVIAPRLTAPPR